MEQEIRYKLIMFDKLFSILRDKFINKYQYDTASFKILVKSQYLAGISLVEIEIYNPFTTSVFLIPERVNIQFEGYNQEDIVNSIKLYDEIKSFYFIYINKLKDNNFISDLELKELSNYPELELFNDPLNYIDNINIMIW